MKLGDIVMVPCKVIGTIPIAATGSLILNLAPIDHITGERYSGHIVRPFTVLNRDVVVIDGDKK